MPKRKKQKRKYTSRLTPDRQRHMKSILRQFKREFIAKYTAGQREHGGNLEDRDCASEAAKEVIDLVAYIHCERSKRARLMEQILKWGGSADKAQACMTNISELYAA